MFCRYYDQFVAIEGKFPIAENQVRCVDVCGSILQVERMKVLLRILEQAVTSCSQSLQNVRRTRTHTHTHSCSVFVVQSSCDGAVRMSACVCVCMYECVCVCVCVCVCPILKIQLPCQLCFSMRGCPHQIFKQKFIALKCVGWPPRRLVWLCGDVVQFMHIHVCCDLTPPVGVVNLAPPVGVVNLARPVGVVNLNTVY